MEAALQVVNLRKALLLQVMDGMLAADAMVTVDGNWLVFWNLLLVGRQHIQGRQQGIAPVAEVADSPFFRLAHVQQQPILSLLQAAFQFLWTQMLHKIKIASFLQLLLPLG